MLRQERTEDPSEALRLALLGWQSDIWTALPGIVESVDLAKGTCTVQPAVQGLFRQKDGSQTLVTMPLCLDVPISWPTGGGYTLTFPLKKGDEGQLVFNSRCIDAWWQSGGVQPQAEIRFHDLSDAAFHPGIRSQPRVLADVSEDNVQLRADDGSSYVEIAEAQMTLKHPTKVKVDSPIAEFTGEIRATGEITAKYGTGDSVTQTGHTHGGVQAGGGNTQDPNPGT